MPGLRSGLASRSRGDRDLEETPREARDARCHQDRHHSRLPVLVLGLLVVFGAAYAVPAAQAPAKKALTVDDYTKWRTISGQEISGDGKWVAYGVSLTNVPPTEAKPVLHLLNLETNQDVARRRRDGRRVLVRLEVDRLHRRSRAGPGRPRRARGRRRSGQTTTTAPTTTATPTTATAAAGRQAPRRGSSARRAAAPPRRRRRRHAASSCAISRPARCSRGRTFSRSRSRRTRRI